MPTVAARLKSLHAAIAPAEVERMTALCLDALDAAPEDHDEPIAVPIPEDMTTPPAMLARAVGAKLAPAVACYLRPLHGPALMLRR